MWKTRIALALIAAPLAACAAAPLTARPTPVAIWRGGDDGLTLRFAEALEDAFRRSPEFSTAPAEAKGVLGVRIPANLDWTEVGGKTRATYVVDFTGPEGQLLGSSRGDCLEDQIRDCAADVLKDARLTRFEIDS